MALLIYRSERERVSRALKRYIAWQGPSAPRLVKAALAGGSEQPLAQAIDQFAIGRREVVVKAIDRFDDDAPLCETGDGAQGVEPCLHFYRHTDTQLRIILDPLAFLGTGRGTAGTTVARP